MEVFQLETIEWLRKLAECNLCPSCYRKYKQSIEPNIQAIITGLLIRPINDWLQTEQQITQIVMKTEGVFKEDIIVVSFVEGSQISKLVDEKKFRLIEKWSMFKKIAYLKNKGIIREYSYQLLERARKKRNNIHNLIAFSKEDYELFHFAHIVAFTLWSSVAVPNQTDISKSYIDNAEEKAKIFLEYLDKQAQIS